MHKPAKIPVTRRFADGGKIDESRRLAAEMAKKYGLSEAPPAPIPQPTQQAQQQQIPIPTPRGGLVDSAINILSGRKAQIDKAAGYAQGGKIRGPGTATSDSIPARVSETGEELRVSTDERILSAEQDRFLEGVAKGAGYESLNAMLADGTGKPVGPTLKAGKRAAAGGLDPDLDPFAYRGEKPFHQADIARAIAAPPTLGAAPLARTEVAGTLMPKVSPFGPDKEKPGSGVFGLDVAGGDPIPRPGRNVDGVITSDSAKAAIAAPMQRPGGIFGTADIANQNDRMAKSLGYASADDFNKQNANAPSGGVAVLGEVAPGRTQADLDNSEKSRRWMAEDMLRRGRGGAAAAAQLMGLGTTERGQDLASQSDMARNETARHGAYISAQRAAGHDAVLMRGQDLRADTAADRIASNEYIAGERISERVSRADKPKAPTLTQERSNAEIDAGRARIAGLTPEEIKRKTANYTATGRENPEYDPTLAKAVTLANRRKIGADDEFDARQQAQLPGQTQPGKPAFTRDDVDAVIGRGADRAKVAERIRSLGGNPADYGL